MASSRIAGGCVNDAAYVAQATAQAASMVTEATTQAAIQALLLTWQLKSQSDIADLRQGLANRRMQMAEAVLAHAAKGWVQEAQFLAATMAEAAPVTQYGLAAAVEDTVEEAWGGADASFDAINRRMGLGDATPCEDHRMGRGLAAVKTDLYSYMLRTAEARNIALGDRRHSRQTVAIGMGRGLLESAQRMGALGANQQTVRGAIIGTINSAVELWGYQDTRWQNASPWARTAPAPVRDDVTRSVGETP